MGKARNARRFLITLERGGYDELCRRLVWQDEFSKISSGVGERSDYHDLQKILSAEDVPLELRDNAEHIDHLVQAVTQRFLRIYE